MSPSLSVVTAVRNGAEFLAEALESVLTQSYGDFEYVVIDDGSTDNSWSLLQSYAEADERLRIHRRCHRGIAASLNEGNALATAPYVAHMDQDDVSLHDRFERQMAFLGKNESVALLGGGTIEMDATGKPIAAMGYPISEEAIRAALRGQPFRSIPFLHSAVIFDKVAVQRIGGYRPLMSPVEDYDLFQRLSEHYPIANLAFPVVWYRRHAHQTSIVQYKALLLSGLAAHESARFRRETGQDPFENASTIDEIVLRKCGVDDEWIRLCLANAQALGVTGATSRSSDR